MLLPGQSPHFASVKGIPRPIKKARIELADKRGLNAKDTELFVIYEIPRDRVPEGKAKTINENDHTTIFSVPS